MTFFCGNTCGCIGLCKGGELMAWWGIVLNGGVTQGVTGYLRGEVGEGPEGKGLRTKVTLAGMTRVGPNIRRRRRRWSHSASWRRMSHIKLCSRKTPLATITATITTIILNYWRQDGCPQQLCQQLQQLGQQHHGRQKVSPVCTVSMPHILISNVKQANGNSYIIYLKATQGFTYDLVMIQVKFLRIIYSYLSASVTGLKNKDNVKGMKLEAGQSWRLLENLA